METEPKAKCPEFGLVKFLIGLGTIGFLGMSVIGLMIVAELNELSVSRSHALSEIKLQIIELRDANSKNTDDLANWRLEVSRRLDELSNVKKESQK
jgi:hypothetical protein